MRLPPQAQPPRWCPLASQGACYIQVRLRVNQLWTPTWLQVTILELSDARSRSDIRGKR